VTLKWIDTFSTFAVLQNSTVEEAMACLDDYEGDIKIQTVEAFMAQDKAAEVEGPPDLKARPVPKNMCSYVCSYLYIYCIYVVMQRDVCGYTVVIYVCTVYM